MGNAWSQLGDHVRGLEFTQRGLALAETVGAVDLLVHLRFDVGMLCRFMGDYRRGAAVLAQAVELGMRPLQAHCHLGLGSLYAEIGQQEQARVELSIAIGLYRAMDMIFWLPQAESTLAQSKGVGLTGKGRD